VLTPSLFGFLSATGPSTFPFSLSSELRSHPLPWLPSLVRPLSSRRFHLITVHHPLERLKLTSPHRPSRLPPIVPLRFRLPRLASGLAFRHRLPETLRRHFSSSSHCSPTIDRPSNVRLALARRKRRARAQSTHRPGRLRQAVRRTVRWHPISRQYFSSCLISYRPIMS
jgi:hypothetical protein